MIWVLMSVSNLVDALPFVGNELVIFHFLSLTLFGPFVCSVFVVVLNIQSLFAWLCKKPTLELLIKPFLLKPLEEALKISMAYYDSY